MRRLPRFSRYQLAEIRQSKPLSELRSITRVALIDDEPFRLMQPLRSHGFNIVELGGDVSSLEQVAPYPVIVSDIRGVATGLNSSLEGAHLISEIRKSYPDKYLVAYTGVAQSIRYSDALSKADRNLPKGAPAEEWVAALDMGLEAVGTAHNRWLRFRMHLLKQGIDSFDLYKLEQAFVASCIDSNAAPFERRARRLPSEAEEMAIAFARTALVGLIAGATSA